MGNSGLIKPSGYSEYNKASIFPWAKVDIISALNIIKLYNIASVNTSFHAIYLITLA